MLLIGWKAADMTSDEQPSSRPTHQPNQPHVDARRVLSMASPTKTCPKRHTLRPVSLSMNLVLWGASQKSNYFPAGPRWYQKASKVARPTRRPILRIAKKFL